MATLLATRQMRAKLAGDVDSDGDLWRVCDLTFFTKLFAGGRGVGSGKCHFDIVTEIMN